MEAAVRSGITVLAITDHDTIDGWDEGIKRARELGITFVRGAEFTAQCRRISVHVLGYLFDPDHPAIAGHLEGLQHERVDRAREITARLSEDYPITWHEVLDHVASGATVGRPHIADTLVDAGVVPNRSAAFDELLSTTSKYYVPKKAPEASDVIRWINDAGGRAVVAHPLAEHRGGVITYDDIRDMADAGLFGIEVEHRDNPVSLRGELRELASKLGLAEFGSSDYHGAGKPNALAEHTTDRSVYESLIQGAFLEV